MVLANSIFRAKQSVSIPTPLETEVMGPTEGHNGRGAVWQMSVKSPKPPILSTTGDYEGLRCRVVVMATRWTDGNGSVDGSGDMAGYSE